MIFQPEHFEQLSKSEIGAWQGRPPGSWARAVDYDLRPDYPGQFDRGLARPDITALCRNPARRTLDLCVLIFAWGGMRVGNGKRILKQTAWVPVCEDLRCGAIDHYQAYSAFFRLAHNNEMPGCGPAYFTKLLMFLPQTGERGIIMDQWTARSVNLLAGRQIVRLLRVHGTSQTYRVAPDNDAAVYRDFCTAVCELSIRLNLSVEEAEMLLFSEGRGRGAWRDYVRENG